MKRSAISIAALAAAIPAGTGLAGIAHAVSKTQTFKGPVVDMRWGPVQAVIKVKNKKITKATVLVAPDTPRSEFIDSQAVPLLQQETLRAQSAGIDEISGATDTSDAYIQSLQSAIKQAKHKKAL